MKLKATALLILSTLPLLNYAETAYISNEQSNDITVINGEKLTVEKTIKVGNRPRGIMLSHDGKTLFICSSNDNKIEALDLATGKITHEYKTPDPELLVVDSENNRLYVANENDAKLSVFDIASNQLLTQIAVGKEPEGVALSTNKATVVVTSEASNQIDFIDTKTLKTLKQVKVDSRPRFAQFTPDDKYLWATSELGGTLNIIDTKTYEIVKKIEMKIEGLPQDEIKPCGIRITKDGKIAFVALGRAAHIAVIDVESGKPLDYIKVGQRVWQIAFDKDQNRLYTANGKTDDVSVIDVKTRKVIKTIKAGKMPWGVAVAG